MLGGHVGECLGRRGPDGSTVVLEQRPKQLDAQRRRHPFGELDQAQSLERRGPREAIPNELGRRHRLRLLGQTSPGTRTHEGRRRGIERDLEPARGIGPHDPIREQAIRPVGRAAA